MNRWRTDGREISAGHQPSKGRRAGDPFTGPQAVRSGLGSGSRASESVTLPATGPHLDGRLTLNAATSRSIAPKGPAAEKTSTVRA